MREVYVGCGLCQKWSQTQGEQWGCSAGSCGQRSGHSGLGRGRTWQLKAPSHLCLLLASSLDSQSFVMLPPIDEVVSNLGTLTSRCLHGKNYCRQVLCLYELSKVGAKGWGSTGSFL